MSEYGMSKGRAAVGVEARGATMGRAADGMTYEDVAQVRAASIFSVEVCLV